MMAGRWWRWRIAERQATPEHVFVDRRAFLSAAGLSAAGLSAAGLSALGLGAGAAGLGTTLLGGPAAAQQGRYPAPRNSRYAVERPLTEEAVSSTYNNFYEFGSHKRIYQAAQALTTQPWQVVIDGLVETPLHLDVEQLLDRVQLEERVYRHRCVEAWSMVVPWTGFALAELVRLARPSAGARYLRMETFHDPDVASGQRQTWYPWPYVEGVTLAEATNELAFLVTGVYGKPLAKQFGAPLRLALPWKYGFKSIKSITRFTFTDRRPVSFWQSVAGSEYGFWANVNPAVPHPRWSQAKERLLGTDEEVPTRLFNGYEPEVADLYKDLVQEPLFM